LTNSIHPTAAGLPTYRGVSGLYNSGMTEDGVSIEEAISGDMLRVAPAISWK
jgi:NAD-dependent deacetylase